ncbi:hypothetical protein AAZX31_17G172200 [Glycine max]|nr:hypothetical protein GLYMA_17G180350v4 [Glycine max]KAH1118981.1 hypothetical protein GYH30_047671 [Glycine max]
MINLIPKLKITNQWMLLFCTLVVSKASKGDSSSVCFCHLYVAIGGPKQEAQSVMEHSRGSPFFSSLLLQEIKASLTNFSSPLVIFVIKILLIRKALSFR